MSTFAFRLGLAGSLIAFGCSETAEEPHGEPSGPVVAATTANTVVGSTSTTGSGGQSSSAGGGAAVGGGGGSEGGSGGGTPLVLDLSFTAAQGFAADLEQYTNYPNGYWTDATIGVAGDGIKSWGGWTGPNYPNGDAILTAANRSGPGAAGGRGLRHYKEYDPIEGTGEDTGGGGVKIEFVDVPTIGSRQREFWFQWWQRWGAGFQCVNVNQYMSGPANGNGHWSYEKSIYISSGLIPGAAVAGYGQGGTWHLQAVQAASGQIGVDLPGWQAHMGGVASDGQWRRFQIHMKADSGTGATDGLMEAWVWQSGDTNPTWSGSIPIKWTNNDPTWPGWTTILLGSNQADVASNCPVNAMYTDFDDVKMSVTGFITQP